MLPVQVAVMQSMLGSAASTWSFTVTGEESRARGLVLVRNVAGVSGGVSSPSVGIQSTGLRYPVARGDVMSI